MEESELPHFITQHSISLNIPSFLSGARGTFVLRNFPTRDNYTLKHLVAKIRFSSENSLLNSEK